MTKVTPCGWCIDKFFDKCIGAIRLPNGGLHFCNNPEGKPTLRCVDCNNQTPGEVDPDSWECIGDHRRKGLLKMAKKTETKPARKVQGHKAGDSCTCNCGGVTKGGKFLPGHDSKFLSGWADKILVGGYSLDNAIETWKSLGLSEAMQNKLRKRVGK